MWNNCMVAWQPYRRITCAQYQNGVSCINDILPGKKFPTRPPRIWAEQVLWRGIYTSYQLFAPVSLSVLSQKPTYFEKYIWSCCQVPFYGVGDYIDVTQSPPPPLDILHDMFVCSIWMQIWLSIGKNDRDHMPIKIPEARTLHNTASIPGNAVEKWNLFRIYPHRICRVIYFVLYGLCCLRLTTTFFLNQLWCLFRNIT